MKKLISLILIIWLLSLPLDGVTQSISINSDGSPPDSTAMVDVKSTTKGFLIPRMTKEQRDSIRVPALGLFIYQTNDNPGFYYFDGTSWKRLYFIDAVLLNDTTIGRKNLLFCWYS